MEIDTSSWSTFYPRPQMRRESFLPLDKNWTVNDKHINMPWPLEAELSDYHGLKGIYHTYRLSFAIPEGFLKNDDRLIIHFGAVDQICTVILNEKNIGKHAGGYLPFEYDITDAITKDSLNHLILRVTDSLSHLYPYGKQHLKPHRMWYTPTSGVWQPIWLEAVPAKDSIQKIRITPDLKGITLNVSTSASEYCVRVYESGKEILSLKGKESTVRVDIPQPHLWSCDDPFLYDMTIETATDKIESYFALRESSIDKNDVFARFSVNKKPFFLHGVLDQGYFHDGHFIPATPAEYEKDILRMKELGFNTLRKHIKIENEAFYYLCDKNGMYILQDMVNSGGYSLLLDTLVPNFTFKKRWDTLFFKKKLTKRQRIFEQHMIETLRTLYNHPSIIGYTIFNEGWGQFESDKMYLKCKAEDPTRFYDSTSGWFAQKLSDTQSEHKYYSEKLYRAKSPDKVLFLSECGGFSRRIDEHRDLRHKVYGYGIASTEEQLSKRIERMYENMVYNGIECGLGGSIYTQLADVEGEINGLYTYNREVCKVDKKTMQKIAATLKEKFESRGKS